MQLGQMWQQMSVAYNHLLLIYQNRGYLTPVEANYASQISQILTAIQSQKMQVDRDLADEMKKHLVKMIIKRM